MLIFKRFLLFYIIVILFNINLSIEDDNTHSHDDKSLASGISDDMSKLSENVENVVESYSEQDEDDDNSLSPDEKKKNKIAKKFESIYKDEFEKAQKVVDRQYSKYVKGRFESLDLMEYATEQLKRFWFTGQCRFDHNRFMCKKYRRNYDKKCPKGWIEYNDSCKAPADYNGLCNDLKDFGGMGPEEKENFAWRCEVEWPCVNEKPLFEGLECPFEWAPISDTLCLAPKSYDGICSPILDVSNFSVEKKSLYEQKCDVRWRRVLTNKLNAEKTIEQFEQNKISGIIDDGIIRIV